ncbi:MAG: GNAT family N-acetyltransferase [Polyangiaceae bacterium]|nr:GNAT family N-acetyltransferase [Polyangiaceae bacterium]
MTYGPLLEEDQAAADDIFSTAFAVPKEQIPRWLDVAGRENVRVLRDGGTPAGCLIVVPMGHYWLGRSVSTMGIAGVGVALDQRGKGVAKRLMVETLQEIAEQKVAMSTLYPATQTLYRAVGYERAGKTLEVKIPSVWLDPGTERERAIEIKRLGEAQEESVMALYAELAREQHGYLDRGPYMWKRVRKSRDVATHGIGFYVGDRLEGYLYLRADTNPQAQSPHHDLFLTDAVAATPRATRAMFRYLYDQRSLVEEVAFRTGPEIPMLSILPENRYDQFTVLDWMVRITNVEAALAGRGYPLGVKTTLEIAIGDPLIEANAGRWIVHVEDGKAQVARGGNGAIAIDVRALAPLYSGYLSATSMRRLGWLETNDAETQALEEIFRSPMPGMCEMF